MKEGLVLSKFARIRSIARAYRDGRYTVVLDDAEMDYSRHIYSIGYILDCIVILADDGIRYTKGDITAIIDDIRKGGDEHD